jgi:hypothetical protein
MLVSPPCADNADDLFTVFLLPVYVNYEQNVCDPRLNGNGANRVPSLLAGLIHTIQTHETLLVFEDQRRQLE